LEIVHLRLARDQGESSNASEPAAALEGVLYRMRDLIRVVILGTGQMGSAIARLVLDKGGLALAGAYARRPERTGADIGSAIGLDRELGVPIERDLSALIARTRPHVAIQATCSTLRDARGEIEVLLSHGVHVVSIAEEMAFPAAASAEIAEDMHALAVSTGVALLGTGVNPGFVLDLLIVLLTGVCSTVQSISAKRVNDLAPYGPSVLSAQGVGLSPEDFQAGLRDGTVVGHIGFPQSIHIIARSLGWDIEEIEETRTPILSAVLRATEFVTVAPGQVAGCLHTAVAYRRGEPVIRLVHPQQVHPRLGGVHTGDFIDIRGKPDVRLSGSPEIPGGEATAAMAVNMIPRVLRAPPGLHTIADLPVPAAILGDARQSLSGWEPAT
jgi:4-hydroxy-tetrahydrodipicolinate reductase